MSPLAKATYEHFKAHNTKYDSLKYRYSENVTCST